MTDVVKGREPWEHMARAELLCVQAEQAMDAGGNDKHAALLYTAATAHAVTALCTLRIDELGRTHD